MDKSPKHIKSRDTKTMDIILIIVGVLLVSFTVAMIWIFRTQGFIPDTLVTCVFATLGGECGVCGWIKTTKERNQQHQWQIEDEQRQREYMKEDKEL